MLVVFQVFSSTNNWESMMYCVQHDRCFDHHTHAKIAAVCAESVQRLATKKLERPASHHGSFPFGCPSASPQAIAFGRALPAPELISGLSLPLESCAGLCLSSRASERRWNTSIRRTQRGRSHRHERSSIFHTINWINSLGFWKTATTPASQRGQTQHEHVLNQ